MAIRSVAAALSVALLLAACGDDGGATSSGDAGETAPGGQTGQEVSDMPEVKADLARVNAPADAPVDEVAAGLRGFAVELAGQTPATDNLVVSPASIAVAFAMAEAGADDATAADIAELFGFPDQPAVHEAMNALTAALEAANHPGADQGSEGVTLELANSLWGQEGSEFGAEFLDTLATHYGAGVRPVDFAGDPDGARRTINAWVADATRDRVPELLRSVDPGTVVALVNAIYLKASWQVPFAEETTTDAPFTLADGTTVEVPTMQAAALYVSADDGDGYQAVQLPYDGNELSMVVIVPDEGTALADFEAGLDGDRLTAILRGLEPSAVDLALPRFDTATELDLGEALTALGLPVPGGDLRGIVPGAGIDQAVHAANITVDEKGTEAAAATAVMGVVSAPTDVLPVTVDRPFLFVVQHDATGTPLFYGRITDPRG
ncbi:MAG TPA: serpin family protein [Acidimicrobiales bacterium]